MENNLQTGRELSDSLAFREVLPEVGGGLVGVSVCAGISGATTTEPTPESGSVLFSVSGLLAGAIEGLGEGLRRGCSDTGSLPGGTSCKYVTTISECNKKDNEIKLQKQNLC